MAPPAAPAREDAAAALDPLRLRAAWDAKPALRAVYRRWFERVRAACVPGSIVEIGSGCGNFKAFAPESIATDVRPSPWIDALADARRMPFADASVDNLVAIDAIHHVDSPRALFAETARVLRPGGRLIAVEPAITPLSRLGYALHHEPARLDSDPLDPWPCEPGAGPYPGNQAIATALFVHGRERFERAFPRLRVARLDRFDLAAYPLTGGFRRWSAIPAALVGAVLRAEARLEPALAPLAAYRCLVVVERIADDGGD